MQSKRWVFTLNNWTDDERINLERNIGNRCSYGIYGREVGDNGTPHLQGFIILHDKRRMGAVKSIVGGRAHLEVARGNDVEASGYCRKDGDFWEFGTIPENGSAGRREHGRWNNAFDLAVAGHIADIDRDILIRHWSSLSRIATRFGRRPSDLSCCDNTWIWGLAGSGKSWHARKLGGDSLYSKPINKWWDAYQNESTVIVDDVGKDHKFLGHFLKIWGDIYAFIAEEKGGSQWIRPQHIIVTSQYPIESIWEDEETQAALNRRFKVINFDESMRL